MACGREPGGKHEREFGPCPAALPGEGDGVNRGKFRGRVCWSVTGTLCNGQVQGPFARKMLGCLNCRFLQSVQDTESNSFILMPRAKK